MAKNAGKIIEKNNKIKSTPKLYKKIIMDFLWAVGYEFIEFIDDLNENVEEIAVYGAERFIDLCAFSVTLVDRILDFTDWALKRSIVLFLREVHETRLEIQEHWKDIVKVFSYFVVAGLVLIFTFSSTTDYEYSYNGKRLGLVREQEDVLSVLGLISDELSQEYGSNIEIDPDQDIVFKKVFSYGREVDSPDTVLKRFTYLGDIQVTSYAIVVNGKEICKVESAKVAKDIIQSVIDEYLKNDDTIYEYVGIAEDVEIVQSSTVMVKICSKSAAKKLIDSGGQEEKIYTVKSGDTLYGICNKLNVKLKDLEKMNKGLDEDSTLQIGQKIKIQNQVSLITVETIEVSTFAESIKYDTEYKESDKYYKGEQITTRAGQKGKQIVTARLTKHNGKTVEREDLNVEVVREPVARIVVKGTKKLPPKKGTGTFSRPVNVAVYRGYGMRWGRMHYGLDYAASYGTPIHAADGGTVVATGWSGAFGYRVTVDHGAGFKTIYAHCSRFAVKAGDKVYKGQTIAYVGNSGRSTGPHCHFEILKNGKNVNPAAYV